MRSIHKQLSLLLLTALAACGSKIDNSPNVILETSLGAIEIEVYPEKAPLSAGDFLNYVDRKYYHGQGFYRVVRADNDPRQMGMSLIQGGRLNIESVGAPIAHETTKMTGLRNKAGSCLLYTSPSPRDRQKSRMPSSA